MSDTADIRINIRVSKRDRDLIDDAADLCRQSRSKFILSAAFHAALDVLSSTQVAGNRTGVSGVKS